MGSLDTNCFWCGKYQISGYIPDSVEKPLCRGCINWLWNSVANPEELPPQPDRRTISRGYLKRLFRQKHYCKHVDWRNVAECLHSEWEPGGLMRWWRWWPGLRKRTRGGGGYYKRRRRGRGGFQR